MIKEITMPAGGQTTDMSIVGQWLVKKGDWVDRGDPLLEIETDKATLTVESFAKGVILEILAETGQKVPAGEIIAYVGDEKDKGKLEEKLKVSQEIVEKDVCINEEEEYQPIDKCYMPFQNGEMQLEKEKRDSFSNIKAMPNAKITAKEYNVSLEDVARHVGKHILKQQDVQQYIMCKKENENNQRLPLTNMRKTIVKRMQESAQTIPAFQAMIEVNMRRCIEIRKKINLENEQNKISYNDILFKCIEAAIRKYPNINASYIEDAIEVHLDVNIGLAVSVEGGLLVPVVHKVQEKTISEIAKANRENIKRAREDRLIFTEMSGGTLTFSNMGMYPITQFSAIINPPEVCILAAGAIEEKLLLKDEHVESIPVMKITGSFDHRVVDGAYAAGFLTELKKIVEDPALALL